MFSVRFKENFIRELKKNKLGIFALICLTLIIILSVFAFLTPYNPDTIDMSNQFISPNLKNIFGTDELGRDYFTRALYGARISLIVGVLSMMVSIFIGTLVGAISGLLGGKVDAIIMRIIDMLMSIPLFFLLLIVNSYLRPSIANIIIIIGIFGWMSIARIVRSETLSIKERDYILCSKALGSNNIKIVKTHIIPNAISTVIVAASINIADAILMESSLSFLGLGVQQPMASLGSMLQTAQSRIGDKTYLAIFPGLMILLIVLSFNVLGDILRVALDPSQGE
ncbi:peptide ABC transporter permease [Clostridium sulfidigenes]|uniref:Peptide ABC transporter permease n=1 Tax=Clostridium sulfidigenes TaxID=318464 RepID=A0A084J8D1_9CLOT|nr:ABC transporter permease [Clostridium sulfidigenes]KEZ85215.1 peptide ABC transporter permease [Clostridium sulfidigenes]